MLTYKLDHDIFKNLWVYEGVKSHTFDGKRGNVSVHVEFNTRDTVVTIWDAKSRTLNFYFGEMAGDIDTAVRVQGYAFAIAAAWNGKKTYIIERANMLARTGIGLSRITYCDHYTNGKVIPIYG